LIQTSSMFKFTEDIAPLDDEFSIVALSSSSQSSAFFDTTENDYIRLQHSIDYRDVKMLSEQILDGIVDDQENRELVNLNSFIPNVVNAVNKQKRIIRDKV
ncbi:10808_t:CDS:2, partial [Racocetra fulgida]